MRIHRHFPAFAAGLAALAAALIFLLPQRGDAGSNSSLLAWSRGKKAAVCSDSISTFAGVIPEDYAAWYPKDYLPTAEQTWWMRLADAAGMEIISNASFSGSPVTGDPRGTDGFYFVDDRRLADIGRNGTPDLIFVMGGANDLFNDRPLGEGKAYTGGQGRIEEFGPALDYLFGRLAETYPESLVVAVCAIPVYDVARTDEGGNAPLLVNGAGLTINDYNRVLRECAARRGISVLETAPAGLLPSDLADGIHPNNAGMEKIAACLFQEMFRIEVKQ